MRGRILQVNRFLFLGGVECYMLALVKALPEYEHHILVNNKQVPQETIRAFTEEGVPVRYLYRTAQVTAEMIDDTEPSIILWHDARWSENEPHKRTHPKIQWVKVSHAIRPEARPDRAYDHVCVSKAAYENAPDTKTQVCRIGLDQSGFYQKGDGEYTVGRYGADRWDKWGEDIPEILAAADSPEVRYKIIGREKHRPEFTHWGLESRTTWHPASYQKKYEYLASFDAAIYRNHASCTESFGISMLELMAAGVPTVADDRGGLKDLQDSGKTGFLVPYEDKPGYVEALKYLRDNKEARQEMGAAARERARREFTPKNMAEAWRAVLRG